MKETPEITCCVVDYGSFISLADKLSETMAKVYYYSPYEEEYRDLCDCVIGDGLEKVERLDEFMEPEVLDSIDLFVFPDIGYGGIQKYLRSIGKAVWGSMGMSDLELYRTRFLKVLEELGLPMVNSVKKVGLTELAEHLKKVEDKWVKINRFRENMETWHHIDFDHSQRELDRLAVELGGCKEKVVFVVQDNIDTDVEIGYDGWTVDGVFPESSFQGYEKKNELYLGAVLPFKDLPEGILEVNRALSPLLLESGYRNFIATEIRQKDGVPYFIDPTMRMPGQTGEQLLETCSNLADVIWRGANGELVVPKFQYQFAAEATLHYTAGSDHWKTIRVPEEVRRWAKLYHYCIVDDTYQFPPHKTDELGVLLGVGETISEAIEHLKANLELLKNEPVSAQVEGFADLLHEIEEAEEEGVEFTDQPIPEPSTVLEHD